MTCKHSGGCSERVKAKGWCSLHYDRIRAKGEPGPVGRIIRKRKGFCQHPDECLREVMVKGWCLMHYQRIQKYGEPGPADSFHSPDRRPRNSGWRKNKRGYVVRGKNGKREYQHRVVMEQSLGRSLREFESPHHKNGIRNDNRIDNLELWTVPQPKGQRVEDLVEWVVAEYRQEVFEALGI